MIKYILTCHKEHEFESWFSDSEEFEKLNKRGLLECIYCSSQKIKKSIMAPMISNSQIKDQKNLKITSELKNEKYNLIKLREFIEKNFEYVGRDFSKKAREIYYDKKSKKAIYGTTSQEERDELAEEGIDLMSIPWVTKDN